LVSEGVGSVLMGVWVASERRWVGYMHMWR
jgi:hypothetical protein